ncbi:hypothetical protein J3A78_002379 [Streptomyces sp. PvR006]|uniref:hypothetical protein n=1 Tax=Streptomyces sp. PvR006 TaxID=2817860 RepID=UPI001AEB74F1|nr:hypothetical protein [Streptomyces sp. PvR006]MBP2581901.1 hypothetical protein [Streptomyces sp. PvR006]
MQITAHKLGSRHKQAFRRVESIADQAAHLVQKKLGEPVGHVEIVVTNTDGYHDSITAAEQRILGTHTRSQFARPDSLAHTTLSPSGALILFDVEATPRRKLDRTVVHELVHAVQFGRPGVRDFVLSGIRNNHRIERAGGWLAIQLQNRKVAAQEREAVRLESLARKIR